MQAALNITNHKYRPEIDGLRAVAVLAVILFHFDLGLTGGFVGVDIFFVISGYLITEIILREIDKSTFTMRAFWERRVRRIAPALLTVVLCSLVAGWFVLLPKDFLSLGESIVSLVFFSANAYFWSQSGYFAAPVESKPLLHCWSLAVEEQFYLIFPLVIVVLFRAFGKNQLRLTLAITVAMLISFAACLYGTAYHRSAAFYLLPTRAWELLAGCALASLANSTSQCLPWVREILSAGGLATIAYCFMSFSERTHFPGWAALLPVCATLAIIWSEAVGENLTHTGRLLSLKPLTFIGLISYSLYLWHWPVLVYVKYWEFSSRTNLESLALIVTCFTLAVLTWRWIEIPFRKRQLLADPRRLFQAAFASMLLLLGLGLATISSRGFPGRLSPQTQQYAAAVDDREFQHEVTVDEARAGTFPVVGDTAEEKPSVIVWGDSHAMAMMPAFDELLKRTKRKGVAATHSSTPPTLTYFYRNSVLKDQSIEWNQSVLNFIRSNDIRQIILVGRWSVYAAGHDCEEFSTGLRATIDALNNDAREVWIADEVPEFTFDIPRLLAWSSIVGQDANTFVRQNRPKDHTSSDALMNTIADRRANQITFAHALGDGEGTPRIEVDGWALYADNNHLSATGARKLILPVLEQYPGLSATCP